MSGGRLAAQPAVGQTALVHYPAENAAIQLSSAQARPPGASATLEIARTGPGRPN